MRRIAATYLFVKPGIILKKGILEVDQHNRIINLIDTRGELRETANLEYYNGILVPGFINCFQCEDTSGKRRNNKETVATGNFQYSDTLSFEEDIPITRIIPEVLHSNLYKMISVWHKNQTPGSKEVSSGLQRIWQLWNIHTKTDYIKDSNSFTILCPRYFHKKDRSLPPVEQLLKTDNLCLGTATICPNSIFEEIKFIQISHPQIPLSHILTWGTHNGARAMGLEGILGTFDKGKKPGVNLITNLDLKRLILYKNSKIRSIL